MTVQDAQRSLHAAAQELGHRRLAGLHEPSEEAERADVAGELVVVPQQPAQDLAPLVLVRPAELAEPVCEVIEDHARLADPLSVMFQDRNLAHLIDLAKFRRARLAVEEVDETGLPVGAAQVQHQRRLIRVARLGEAIEAIFGHGLLPEQLSQGFGELRRRDARLT
jgi:hypothetical protein